MVLTGRLLIGFESVSGAETFRAIDPARGVALEPPFAVAAGKDVDRACRLADAAFDDYRQSDHQLRGHFLELCARNLMDLGAPLLERAELETGLPRARLEGERLRTCRQLQLFAEVVRAGGFLQLRVDRAQPERQPLPRADLRLRKIPLGPVAVFGASNFPLAFSSAGGDVASALAAGCPVVVKAHPSHPGTSELAARAISSAALEAGLPDGVYSHLSSPALELGRELVKHPAIKAVAFTGSRAGGLALAGLAAGRVEPIPVFAEMSSINPVILLKNALQARPEVLANGYIQSLTLGAGQFCTNPGLVLALAGAPLEQFLACAGTALSRVRPGQMLSAAICGNYRRGLASMAGEPGVVEVSRGLAGKEGEAGSALFRVGAAGWLSNERLHEEVFGPAGLVVECRDVEELGEVLRRLEGQLTLALHLDPADYPQASLLMPLLERKAGRVLSNAWPTGVEVCHAMVHGGPYPATSDARFTSVGSLAIDRFLRPVCYQDMPQELLPPELRDSALSRYPRLDEGMFRGVDA